MSFLNMKISTSSNSIELVFNNLEIDICYPLVVLQKCSLIFKLNSEISYYRFDNYVLSDYIEYYFTFLVLGFGFIIIYAVKKD